MQQTGAAGEHARGGSLKRRGLFAGAAALAALLLGHAAPTEAADGDTLTVGGSLTGTDPGNTTSLTAHVTASSPALRVTNGAIPYSGTLSAYSDGLQGYALDAENAGVSGRNDSAAANGQVAYGVYGSAAEGAGVYGNAVNANDTNPNRVGVQGNSDSGSGVVGTSTSAIGVYGTTQATTGDAAGVYGLSGTPSNPGNQTGVYGGCGNGNGVVGSTTTGCGVVGSATGPAGLGVLGYCEQAWAAIFYNPGSNVALLACEGADVADFYGNVVVSGNFSVTGSKAAVVPAPDGSYRTLYCVESPESWFEDYGAGQLSGGQAQVTLDPAFAALIKPDKLHVFVVAEGDCLGLFVAAKSGTGFTVQELQGGKSTAGFSWRVLAKRKDIEGPRLAQVTLPQRPKLPKPPRLGSGAKAAAAPQYAPRPDRPAGH